MKIGPEIFPRQHAYIREETLVEYCSTVGISSVMSAKAGCLNQRTECVRFDHEWSPQRGVTYSKSKMLLLADLAWECRVWARDIAMYVCATEAFRPYARTSHSPALSPCSARSGRASICYASKGQPALLISHFGGKDILRGLYGSLAELIGPQIARSDVSSSALCLDFCLISILFREESALRACSVVTRNNLLQNFMVYDFVDDFGEEEMRIYPRKIAISIAVGQMATQPA